MSTTLVPVGRWDGQPAGFCAPLAEAVYKAIADCPDDESAAITGRIIVEALQQRDLVVHGHDLVKAVDGIAKSRADILTKQLARTAVAKARRGESAAAEIADMALLAKAAPGYVDGSPWDDTGHPRDLRSGRFVREHQRIGYDDSGKALNADQEKQFGIAPAGHLKDRDRARYQQAYAQLHEMIAPFTGMGDAAMVHLHIHDKNGPNRTVVMPVPGKGQQHTLNKEIGQGEHLHSASISVVPPVTAAGAAFDATAGISPTLGGVAYNTVAHGAGNTDRLTEFANENARDFPGDEYVPSARIFRRIGTSSKLLSDSLGDAAPRKLQFALKVGEHVGTYGPEAQKVIGPTADRAAYRYRGTERDMPEALVNSLNQIHNMDVSDKRWYLLHGNARPDGTTPTAEWRPSGTIGWLRTQLPKIDLSNLHLKSGAVPPSRGVVFDKHGNATNLAVGYGDDHYLPFNLRGKSFRALRGGEYIRTRTFGGPTTEDIYTGLMSGAKGFAVVSHNGTFTVDFAPDLKGGKRFNDNAARMVSRYGYLLDAVRSGQVETGGIDGSRLRELRDKAASIYPESTHPEQFQTEYGRLKEHEKKHPELSGAQRNAAILDFFNTQALSPGRGMGASRESLVAGYVREEAATRWTKAQDIVAEYNRNNPSRPAPPPPSLEHFNHEVTNELANTPVEQLGAKYAGILGMKGALEAHIAQAERENAARLRPLALNGEGYEKALQALQEEFPHQIADTQFHPWSSARGPVDTGYVRPRHNRAAAAMGGYFDVDGVARGARIGRGKVFSDTTRWQNGQREPRLVTRPGKPAAEGQAAAAGTGARPNEDAGTNVAMRRGADLDLLRAYAGATNFAGNAEGNLILDANVLRNYPINQLLGDPDGKKEIQNAAPNLASLFAYTPQEAEAAYAENPDRMRQVLAGAKAENARLHWVDAARHEAAFDRGGRPVPKRTFGDRASDSLDHLEVDHDFDIPAYDAAMLPKTGQVNDAYAADAGIGALVKSGDLPDSPGDTTLRTKALEIAAALKLKRQSLQNRELRGERVGPGEWGPLDRHSEAIVRALQLGRRHREAADREVEIIPQAEPAAAGGGAQNAIFVLGGDEDEQNANLRRLGLNPP